jgi:hypothetical protein
MEISNSEGASYGIALSANGGKWCTPADSGNWYRSSSSGSSYNYSAKVKFADKIGIDLGISRNYSSNQKLHYHIVANSHGLCGNNAFPASAGKVEERYAA